MAEPSDSGRRETEDERADRNLSDLLQELRVALPGVQVLFAFLLTVPFSQRFSELSKFQQWLYFGVMITVALATVMLVAPTAGHRILFRRQQKEFIVTLSNTLALAGLLLLAIAMTGVDRSDQRLHLRHDDGGDQHGRDGGGLPRLLVLRAHQAKAAAAPALSGSQRGVGR